MFPVKDVFTQRYVEMSKKAEEIQKIYQDILKEPDRIIDDKLEGSYVWCPYGIILLCNGEFCIADDKELLKSYIWLPLQEQLQKIIADKGYFRFSLIEMFYHFANKNVNEFDSMEELWLAYTMWIKYNKVWDDKKKNG